MSEDIISECNDGIVTLTINRAHKRNALNGEMVKAFKDQLSQIAADDAIRVLLITGEGSHFCAGGDIAWMQQIARGTEDENYDDAQQLADLLLLLYQFNKPTIVLAKGSVLGGGMGLLTAADIAIASRNSMFGLPEVKIGLTPSMISPYVIAAIGQRASHYYFLTGERFDADTALKLGLIHQVVDDHELIQVGISLAKTIMSNSPKALAAAKQLLRFIPANKISVDLAQKTAEHLANLRATPEAQEGLLSFIEKRKPSWVRE